MQLENQINGNPTIPKAYPPKEPGLPALICNLVNLHLSKTPPLIDYCITSAELVHNGETCSGLETFVT